MSHTELALSLLYLKPSESPWYLFRMAFRLQGRHGHPHSPLFLPSPFSLLCHPIFLAVLSAQHVLAVKGRVQELEGQW